MRRMVWLLFVLEVSCVAFAQSDRTSWVNLSSLQPGQRIEVAAVNSNKHSGNLVSISDTAISYRQTNHEWTHAKQDVLSVKLMDHKHRLRNTLIVAGVGAGVGAGIGAALHKPCSSPSFCLDFGGAALPAAVGAVLGGLGGAVVGILLPSHSTIYQVSSH
jgi:hypothetical protein